MKKLAALALLGFASLIALPVLLMIATANAAGGDAPSDTALAEIPPDYLDLYMAAPGEHCPQLDWSVLAAIGFVETRHGTLDAPGVHSGQNFAGAAGPMQFGIGGKAGNTWGGPGPVRAVPPHYPYGVDANGDGIASVYDPADGIHAAAGYLCAHGAGDPARIRQAIWAYNHSWEYVDTVLAMAAEYSVVPAVAVPASGDLIADVLANPRLKIYEAGREDIRRGRIDARVLTLLQQLSTRYELYLSSLQTGHSRCIGGGDYPGCSVSKHHLGSAVDIAIVNDELVRSGSPAAYELTLLLASLEGPLRPDEVGSPWPIASPGQFTNGDHLDHIHIGYES
jgi:hypothetical protein